MCRGNGGSAFNIQTLTGTFAGNSDTLTVDFESTFRNPPKIQVSQILTDGNDSHVNIYVESVTKSNVTLRSSNVKGTLTKVHVYAIGNG